MQRSSAITILVISTAALFFEAWFAGLSRTNFATKISSGSIAQNYTMALAHGKAYLDAQPDVQLLKDSKLPASRNWTFDPLDSSLYKGRFYIYFGIVPFLFVLVPWAIVTHTFLSDAASVVLFLFVGHLMYGAALRLVLVRRGGTKSVVRFAAALVTIIACSGTWALIGRPAIYEIVVAGAYACFATCVLFLVLANEQVKWKPVCLMASVTFAALAIGCRPNYCMAAAVVFASALLNASTSTDRLSKRWLRTALVFSPIAIVGLGLAFWNYYRFLNPFEFGFSYTAFYHNYPAIAKPSFNNFLYNTYCYWLGGFRLEPYFPFIAGMKRIPISLPADHEDLSQVYGCLWLFPIIVWTAFANYSGEGRSRFRTLAIVLLCAAFSNFLLIACLGFGTYRYPVDFLGPIAFLAALGMICPFEPLDATFRRVLAFCLPPFFIWSIAFGLFEAASIAQSTSLFSEDRPIDFERMAYPFNRVAYMMERVIGTGPRYLNLNLIFPRSGSGVEPLLVYGDPGSQDFLYVYYASPDSIQLGFESIGHGGPVSAYIPIDYKVQHRIGIDLGSFLPPGDHPLMKGTFSKDRFINYNFIHLTLDSQVVLEAPVELHRVAGRVMIGASADNPAFGSTFSGTIVSVERPSVQEVGVFPNWKSDMFGPLVESLKLSPMPSGTSEPLISVGYRRSGGMLAIQHLAGSQVRLKWVDYTKSPTFSQPFMWTYDRPHKVEASFGSLLPPVASALWRNSLSEGERAALKHQIRFQLDGTSVWTQEIETPDASPYSVALGTNDLSLSGVSVKSSGQIISATRGSWDSNILESHSNNSR
jgi:hypothetical protein